MSALSVRAVRKASSPAWRQRIVDRHTLHRDRSRRWIQGAPREGSLSARRGRAAENIVEGCRPHLAAERTCCVRASRRIPLASTSLAHRHAEALSRTHVAQFDTLRSRLLNIAVGIVDMRTRIPINPSTASPAQVVLRHVLGPIPRDGSDKTRQAPPSNPSGNVLSIREQPGSPLPTAARTTLVAMPVDSSPNGTFKPACVRLDQVG